MNVMTLCPTRDRPPGLTATSVCFEEFDDYHRAQLIGIEYAQKRALTGVDPLDERDDKTLAQIGRIISRRGKLRRFGVRLLHDPLKLDGRILLENSDIVNRILTCHPTRADDPAMKESIPTVFCWNLVNEPVDNALAISQTCEQTCKYISKCSIGRDRHHDRDQSHDPVHYNR